MSIGAFSISLTVKNIQLSKVFYEKLGFEVFHGNIEENWLIMKNDECTIGLFQGMFDNNILTFNPGWDSDAQPVSTFKDVRILQQELKDKGLKFEAEVEPDTKGPGSFAIKDPDGNLILVDQHV